jgi:hypothetical protein
LPVSFSTIEAIVTACSGVETGQSVARFGQSSASVLSIALCIRATKAARVSPR